MIRFSRSATGKRARAPRWWGKILELVPAIPAPWLEPHQWSKTLALKWIYSIPPKCPFERQIWLGERLILYIPPLCPLNPFSAQLYKIRLQAQTYLTSIKD